MTAKTITTQTGSTITVEMGRKVQDKVNYSDGYNVVTGREVIDSTVITLRDVNGKLVSSGNSVRILNAKIDAKGIAGGAVGKIGSAYLSQKTSDLISGLIAAVEAETHKSSEQIEIEAARYAAGKEQEAWYNSPEQVSYRKFQAEMERADSDY